MSDPWADAPSPCVDVCKYKRQGRCVGCTMTKAEKDAFPQSGSGPMKDVCKYKRQGRCVGCTMTKAEKDAFPQSGSGPMKKAFIMGLIERVSKERNPAFWAIAYRRKCERAGVACPLDVLEEEDR